MKQFKIFWGLLFAVLLLTTATVGADMMLIDCNSEFFLEYGQGAALCADTSSVHSYSTVGRTYGAPNTCVAVYVLNASGKTMASDSSSGYYDVAIAQWTQSIKTPHKHKAGSASIQ